jgi:hypothetical protein
MSGCAGVTWEKASQKWRVEYKRKYHGLFNTKEEAIAKRKQLEQDLNDSMEEE